MKNMILETVTALAAVLWLVSACMLDSVSVLPIVLNAVSLAWLGLFIIANQKGA